MILKYDGNYKSINSIKETTLPNFTILIGINGSGKSQLLDAIYKGIRDPDWGSTYGKISIKPYINNPIQNTIKLNVDWWLNSTNKQQNKNQTSIINHGLSIIQSKHQQQYENYLNNVHNLDLSQNIESAINSLHSRNQPLQNAIIPLLNLYKKDRIKLTFQEFKNHISNIIPKDSNELVQQEILYYNFENYRYNKINYHAQKKESVFTEHYGDVPWDIFNSLLESLNLPYKVSIPSDDLMTPYYFELIHKYSGKNIDSTELSSGEKVLIQILYWIFNSRTAKGFPELILLDEPDAYLHPSMVRFLINTLNDNLVNKYNCKIILTTHSPTTVAIAPENSIYEIDNSQSDKTKIRKLSQDYAIKKLTSDIPTLHIREENRKIVFVESTNDVKFYEKFYALLKNEISTSHSLTFISSGFTQKKQSYDGDCSRVSRATQTLRDLDIKNIYGIIDWDNKKNGSEYVKVLGLNKRYSIEQYIYDPLILSIYLIRDSIITRSMLNIPETFGLYEIKNFSSEQFQDLSNKMIDIFKSSNLFDVSLNDYTVCNYIGGFSINIPNWFLECGNHKLDEHIPNIFCKLKSTKDFKNKLLDTFIEFPELISIDLKDLFDEIISN